MQGGQELNSTSVAALLPLGVARGAVRHDDHCCLLVLFSNESSAQQSSLAQVEQCRA